MGARFSLTGALASEPLRVPDPWDIGWTFLCARSTASIFRPLATSPKRMGLQRKALLVAEELRLSQVVTAIRSGGTADLAFEELERRDPDAATLGREWFDATIARLVADERITLDGDAYAVPGKLEDDLPDDLARRVDELYQEMDAIAEREADPEDVAAVVVGWEGVEEEGKRTGYSPKAILSLLSDAPVDDVNFAVMDGEAPQIIPVGEWAGYTVGAALCAYLPRAIELATAAETVEREEKKDSSTRPNSSRPGSGTKTTRKRSKPRGSGAGK